MALYDIFVNAQYGGGLISTYFKNKSNVSMRLDYPSSGTTVAADSSNYNNSFVSMVVRPIEEKDDGGEIVGNPIFSSAPCYSYDDNEWGYFIQYIDENGERIQKITNIFNENITVSDTPSKPSCIKTSAKLGGT